MSGLSLRELAALWVCRLSRGALRLLGRGGTNLPGQLALRICPTLLKTLARNVRVIVVSGTNGKTTTCRILEEGLRQGTEPWFSNRSGANLIAGITAEFAAHTSWRGRPACRRAVIECDELAAPRVYALMQPETVVLTNLFRDQLDRCGEVTNTLRALKTALDAVPKATVCINADDSLLCSLAEGRDRVVYFGMTPPAQRRERTELSDAAYCIHCRTAYEYDFHTFGHLGGFRCPKCGYRRPEPAVEAALLEAMPDGSRIALRLGDETRELLLPIPAEYNVYNAAAAAAALYSGGADMAQAAAAIESSHCGFGRTEQFALGRGARMLLVKNPAGCNQVLHYLESMDEPFVLAMCLNDLAADGTDISWIWDADFECLAALSDRLVQIYVSGRRGEELALRLKYAGLDPNRVQRVEQLAELVPLLAAADAPSVIVPTYTAMMELRPHLVKAVGGSAFWE